MTRMVGLSVVQGVVLTVALCVGAFFLGGYVKESAVELAVSQAEGKLNKQAEDFKRKLLAKDDELANHDAKLLAQFDKQLKAILARPGAAGACLSAADVKQLRNLFARRPR